MSSRDKRFIHIIEETSDSCVFQDALKEWKPIEMSSKLNSVVTCICGTVIFNKYPIENKSTGIQLVIGSECIYKFNNSDMTQVLQLRITGASDSLSGARLCQNCCDYTIRSPDLWKVLCDTCYAAGIRSSSLMYTSIFGISCGICSRIHVPKRVGATTCIDCYKLHKAHRECQTCNRRNIPGNCPGYIHLCTECQQDMKLVGLECFVCGQNTIMPDDGPVGICKKCSNSSEHKNPCEVCHKHVLNPNKSFIKICRDCVNANLVASGSKSITCPTVGCNSSIPPGDAKWMKICNRCYATKKLK